MTSSVGGSEQNKPVLNLVWPLSDPWQSHQPTRFGMLSRLELQGTRVGWNFLPIDLMALREPLIPRLTAPSGVVTRVKH